jgi:hypothetical protein
VIWFRTPGCCINDEDAYVKQLSLHKIMAVVHFLRRCRSQRAYFRNRCYRPVQARDRPPRSSRTGNSGTGTSPPSPIAPRFSATSRLSSFSGSLGYRSSSEKQETGGDAFSLTAVPRSSGHPFFRESRGVSNAPFEIEQLPWAKRTPFKGVKLCPF